MLAARSGISRSSVSNFLLKLAYDNGKLQRVPIIRKLREAEPRAGFFEPAAFAAVRARLRSDLQLAVTLAYTYGWRTSPRSSRSSADKLT